MFFLILFVFFFFFNDTATTEIYTLSLHDALPISSCSAYLMSAADSLVMPSTCALSNCTDRKSTRLNSSHGYISYAVFCLKKKKTNEKRTALHLRVKDDNIAATYVYSA